ncbi:MAG: hypothetical protein P1V51_04110 [Deltaproteobacteria bacterium]|nr:hypothetical protein [Deltaproteobacteria bacterium]
MNHRHHRSLSSLSLLLFLGALACGPKGGGGGGEPVVLEPGPLQAAAVVRVLDLPVGQPTSGYMQSEALGGQHPLDDPGSAFAEAFPATRGLQSAPTARVVLLDNGHTHLAIVRLDMIYINWELTERVQRLAREQLGLDLEGKLLLNATHTHAAGCRLSQQSLEAPLVNTRPEGERHAWAHGGDTYSEEAMRRVAGNIVDALGAARDALQPAAIGHAFGENLTAARDRRCENDFLYGAGDHDTRVSVIRIDAADSGDPIAVLFQHPMHGTIYGAESRNLSVDAPGHAEYAVEEGFDRPVVAVYLQGAAGDVSPAGDVRGHSDSQAMARVGWDLARTVLELHPTIETRTEIVLDSLERRVATTYDDLGYVGDEFLYDGGMLCNTIYGYCGQEEGILKDDVWCVAPAIEGKGKYATWMAAARIGDLHLITLPGEPLTEVGRRMLANAAEEGATDTLLLGYAMDHDGYILTEDDWLAGGYETTITLWGWRHGDYLLAQGRDLLHELRFGEALDLRPVTPPVFRPVDDPPYAPTASTLAPAVAVDVPATLGRMTEVRFAFHGGDPALGHPEVLLERQAGGGFEPVLTGGWRKVSSLTAGSIPLIYTPTPTPKEAPDAASREHLWEAVWASGPALPAGDYRLRVLGRHQLGGGAEPYELISQTMTVEPSRTLEVDLEVRAGSTLWATLRYPSNAPMGSGLRGSEDWQIGGFPMISPHWAPPFLPVTEGGQSAAPATVAATGTSPLPLNLVFDPSPEPSGRSYGPGEGPGFSALLPPGTGWELTLPAGALTDAHGNTHAAISVSLSAP